MTQLYDDALRPYGLRSTQFTLLLTLDTAGKARQTDLSDLLAIDGTTLTRNLAVLRRKRWIGVVAGSDRRERLWSLSPEGRRILRRSMPAWESAQGRLERALGERAWKGLRGTLDQVLGAAKTA